MTRAKLCAFALVLALAGCGGSSASSTSQPATAGESGGGSSTESGGGSSTAAADATGADSTAESGPETVASAEMHPTEGNDVQGTVLFEQKPNDVQVTVDLTGFEPNSVHGFHVHENGDCSAADGTSAGGHYNPESHSHGLPTQAERHGGDMGNLQADENGEVHQQLTFDIFSVDAQTPPPVVGHAVIVHAQPDDGSQPTGAAGPRVACGVIQLQEQASSEAPAEAESSSEEPAEGK